MTAWSSSSSIYDYQRRNCRDVLDQYDGVGECFERIIVESTLRLWHLISYFFEVPSNFAFPSQVSCSFDSSGRRFECR